MVLKAAEMPSRTTMPYLVTDTDHLTGQPSQFLFQIQYIDIRLQLVKENQFAQRVAGDDK